MHRAKPSAESQTLTVFLALSLDLCLHLFDSALDGVGIGLGFTLSLTVIGAVREVLGSGAIFGYDLGCGDYMPLVFVLAPGAFLVLGFLMVLFNKFLKK